jgi:hypothetical protein
MSEPKRPQEPNTFFPMVVLAGFILFAVILFLVWRNSGLYQ